MTLRVPPDEIVERSTSDLLASHPTWERVRLGDVAEVLNGFAFKSTYFTKNAGVPLLRIRDVGKSTTEAFYEGEYDDRYLVRPGELVVGMDGDFRVARWLGTNALLNQRVCKLSVRDARLYDEVFLYYVLPGYLEAVHALTSSVTVKHLSSRTVLDMPIPLPPLPEQRRIIAAIEEQFSRLDAAERFLSDCRARCEALRRAALEDSLRPIGASLPLGEMALTQLGKMLSSKAKTGTSSGPYLRNKNVRWYGFELNDLFEMDFSEAERTKFALASGDVVICEGGEVGRAAVWLGEVEPCFFQKAVHRVRPGADLDPHFLVHVLRWYADRNAFERYVTGSTIAHLPQEDLRTLPIPFTTLTEQKRVVSEIERRLSLIEAVRAAVVTAQKRSSALRLAILERAFRGELVSQDPEDEPAPVLLERIRAERAAAPKSTRKKRVTA